MSNRRVQEATLDKFEGPFFPRGTIDSKGKDLGLPRIQKRFAYHPERINCMLLDHVAEKMDGGRVIMHVVTNDGYMTTGLVVFNFGGNRWRATIPMLHDSEKKDGTYSDRHVALYAASATTKPERAQAAVHFAEVFDREYRGLYYDAIQQSKARKKKSA